MIDVYKLKIYNLARKVRKEIFDITKVFPVEEKYGLTSQLNRSANSIGANISEGAGRRTKADFHKFLFISYGSLKETIHHLEVAGENKYLKNEKVQEIRKKLDNLGAMISLFIRNSN